VGVVAEAEVKDPVERIRRFMSTEIRTTLGLDDVSGLELLGVFHSVMRLYEFVGNQGSGDPDLSGPRWGLLLLLLVQERRHGPQGLTPTVLSRFQGVSKNTISSLLRGLEEQGYIQRTLDPGDYRVFRIRLTDKGREVVEAQTPGRLEHLNRLASRLSAEEREQLMALLGKLHHSILSNLDASEIPPRGG
jgi:DNA-binding MarR family transcriptional regulator